jgi:transglutaminase-like putative cysteine protease
VGALIWGLAAAVAAGQVGVPAAWAAAFAGAAAGYLAGPLLARLPLRLPVLVLAGVALGAVGALAARLPAWLAPVCRLAGAEGAYATADALDWLGLSLVVVALLRCASQRLPFLVGLEVALVALALALPFAAHREGFINRPHFLVDPLWSRGHDPVPVLLGLGAGAAVMVLVLSMGRTTRRASALDALLVAALVAGIFVALPVGRLQQMVRPPPGLQGLRGQATPPPGQGQPPGPGGQAGDIPLQDDYSRPRPRPVAVVLLHDEYEPAEGYYYFRQSALSQYNGFRLVADTTGQADTDLAREFPLEPLNLPLPPGRGRSWRPLRTTVALIEAHNQPFGLVDPARLEPAENPDPQHFLRAYQVTSQVYRGSLADLLGRRAGNPTWSPQVWEHYTRLPDDPRYGRLAREIVAGLPPRYQSDPLAQAAALKLYLEKKGTYSRHSRHLAAQDPVADFLFGDMTGYCVHFAYAETYLARSLGLPARIAAGYAVSSRYRGSGSAILIRDAESHAWPEIYLEGAGWVVLDIAPQRSEEEMLAPPDPDLQRMMGQMARQEVPGSDGPETEKRSLHQVLGQLLRGLGLTAAGLVLLAVALGYAVKAARRLAPYASGRVLDAYRAGLDLLAEAGRLRGYGQSRESFAALQEQDVPSLGKLTELHLAQALGRPEGRPRPPRHQVLALYRALAAEVRASTPRGRRLLGLLDPFSWLKVK